MSKYIVAYAKIADDKKMGAVLVGTFFGGICNDEDTANDLAIKCASEIQGGIIIPKILKMPMADLVEVMTQLEAQFEKLANQMYENEEILRRNTTL